MKFVRIGDVVLNRDLVESVVVNMFVYKAVRHGTYGFSKENKPKGVKVVLANNSGHHIFENETLESVMDKLNRDYNLAIGGESQIKPLSSNNGFWKEKFEQLKNSKGE